MLKQARSLGSSSEWIPLGEVTLTNHLQTVPIPAARNEPPLFYRGRLSP